MSSHLSAFVGDVVRDQRRRVSERIRAATASASFLPGALAEQQFLRYVHYVQLADRIAAWTRNRPGLRVIEFGGSNGVIRGYFEGAVYEVAPNYPDVDVQDLSRYPSQAYDAVVVDQVLEHVPHPAQAVSELRRLLTPGGVCIATTPFLIRIHGYPNDYQRFTAQGLEVLFREFETCDVDGWGNRYTLDVIQRYGWLSARNTRRLLNVALWNEPEWPIDYLTWATR